MRIAHLVSWLFLAPDDGGRVKTASIASALARCGELHVIDLNRRPWQGRFFAGERRPLPFGGEAVFWSCLPGDSPAQRLGRRLFGVRAAAARRIVERLAPEVIVADDLRALQPALRARGRAAVVAHTHNVESQLHLDVAAGGWYPDWKRRRRAAAYARAERQWLPLADEVWGVREDDLRFYRGLGVQRLRLAPNTLPAERFAEPSVGRAGRALFFGSLWWPPNREAAGELHGLAQRLRGQVDALEVLIAGRGDAPADVSGVRYLGFVDDLKPLARDAAAIVIPLRSGGGTKVKTLEALALGKPLVTTPEGAAGLALVDGVHARVCELGPRFDRAAAEVLREPAAFVAMARAGQQWIRERFSQAALDRAVADGVGAVLARRRAP